MIYLQLDPKIASFESKSPDIFILWEDYLGFENCQNFL